MHGARKATGVAAAALLSAGIGVFVIGLMTTLNEALELGPALNWWPPAGPLTGKTGLGVLAWLASWIGLHMAYRERELAVERVARWTWVLVLLGLLGIFPPFFERFAH